MTKDLQRALASPELWLPVDVTDWEEFESDEPVGTKKKLWVIEPGVDQTRWLFKRPHKDVEGYKGEDWAEWIVYRIASQLGLPVAVALPALRNGNRGSISRSVRESDQSSIPLGNELLGSAIPGYARDQKRENPQYTVAAIHSVFEKLEIRPPRDSQTPSSSEPTAFEVFAAYLNLDALVGGQDRNHTNWGAERESDGALRLMPTFDHGNALGYQHIDEWVDRHASPDAIKAFAEKGRSKHFAGRPLLVDVAKAALQLCSEEFQAEWEQRIRSLDISRVQESLASIPSETMSDNRRMFIVGVLEENKRRLT